jgi:arginine deiminase
MEPRTEQGWRSAYGGAGWRGRDTSLRQELGRVWAACGQDTEWAPLEAVLLHRPGAELDAVTDPAAALMLDRPDPGRARAQHDALAEAYRSAGVAVSFVEPPALPPPNLMYVADLFLMTPEGAILGRPASAVRAGEERFVQRRLAEMGVPILRAVGGRGTFEGADAMWLDAGTVLLGVGIRTNDEGATQVATVLDSLGVRVVRTAFPRGAMHLMGQLRIVDRDLAFHWPGLLPADAAQALEGHGYAARPAPDEGEVREAFALNFVTLGPRRILMPAGCPVSQAAYEAEGITCHTVEVAELGKGAGAIGCLTGIVRRHSA